MSQRIHRALIVDDEEGVRDALAGAMTSRSFWCETAADGLEALAKYRASRHDLAVVDLRMPRMHGYALALELLKDGNPPHIVVLTGVSEPSLVKDLLSRGVDDVVSKPFDARVFATKMSAIFEKDQWREALTAAKATWPAGAGHTLVAKIENSFDELSNCVSEELESLLTSAQQRLPEPPQAMLNYLERNFEEPGSQGERRKSDRVSLLATVTAVPVTDKFQACGEAFKAAARDISQGGMSLLHTRAVSSDYLGLRWQSLASTKCFVKVVMQVSRCAPMGPFYELGGQFVTRD